MSVLDQFRLDDRVALVTGGSRGLGRVIAHAFAEAGAWVAVTSRDAARAEAAAAEIAEKTGRCCLGLSLDVRDQESVTAAVHQTIDTFAGLHILVNSAGANIREPITTLADEHWANVIDTNLTGTMRCCRAVADRMAAQGWGRIINMASIFGLVAWPARDSYCASKAGLLGLTRAMALDLATTGVTVNALCPGPFPTEINRELLDDPERLRALVEGVPMGRLGELPEITGAALLLASDAGSFITGSALYLDGGWTAR
jgi:NAD(P)-dependent dehydrogenase (short-subunit alcohol dehydrogenase family)